VTLRSAGREMAHPELGMKLLQKVKADFEPGREGGVRASDGGRQMIMILAPK
jgi:translation initiation factor IF-3